MRISDRSSDVCSSDLLVALLHLAVEAVLVGLALLELLERLGELQGEVLQRAHRHQQGPGALRAELGLAALAPELHQLDAHDAVGHDDGRSEEHTSELQSLMRISYAVFCLKKKTTKN